MKKTLSASTPRKQPLPLSKQAVEARDQFTLEVLGNLVGNPQAIRSISLALQRETKNVFGPEYAKCLEVVNTDEGEGDYIGLWNREQVTEPESLEQKAKDVLLGQAITPIELEAVNLHDMRVMADETAKYSDKYKPLREILSSDELPERIEITIPAGVSVFAYALQILTVAKAFNVTLIGKFTNAIEITPQDDTDSIERKFQR